MTAPDDLTGAWLPGPAQFGSDGCTCRPFTTDPPRFLDQPGDTVGRDASWQRGTDCVHHAAEAERDEDAGSGWTQLEARAFNAVQPALRQAGEWLPLSARRAVAKAVLTAVREHLDIGEAEAWCKTCRRVWDGPGHRCDGDAERRLGKVRELRSDLRATTGARWIAEALDTILDQPMEQP